MNPPPAVHVAVIDIGSNTIKLLVARRAAGSHGLEEIQAHALDARLGTGLGRGGTPRLGPEGMARGLGAIRELLARAAVQAPAHVALVATSAVRDAADGDVFRAEVLTATGHPVRVLTGEEEAAYIGRGLSGDPTLAALRDFYVCDLGGGSLEILKFRDRHCEHALSLRLGCVRVTERFIPEPAGIVPATVAGEIARHVRAELRGSGLRFNLPADAGCVLTGGTMATVRALWGGDHGIPFEDTPSVYTIDTLDALLDRLGPLDLAARRALPGMPAARADVFPAALITLHTVAELLGAPRLYHSARNLRWGLAAELLGPGSD
jgi:exopolyphosphatase / guanosine-5'-triphosphate,3'-diphosphate pyrophosphatase